MPLPGGEVALGWHRPEVGCRGGVLGKRVRLKGNAFWSPTLPPSRIQEIGDPRGSLSPACLLQSRSQRAFSAAALAPRLHPIPFRCHRSANLLPSGLRVIQPHFRFRPVAVELRCPGAPRLSRLETPHSLNWILQIQPRQAHLYPGIPPLRAQPRSLLQRGNRLSQTAQLHQGQAPAPKTLCRRRILLASPLKPLRCRSPQPAPLLGQANAVSSQSLARRQLQPRKPIPQLQKLPIQSCCLRPMALLPQAFRQSLQAPQQVVDGLGFGHPPRLQHRQALLPHQLRLQFPTQQEIGGSQLPIQLWRGGSLLELLL